MVFSEKTYAVRQGRPSDDLANIAIRYIFRPNDDFAGETMSEEKGKTENAVDKTVDVGKDVGKGAWNITKKVGKGIKKAAEDEDKGEDEE
jgi:hypothetical protein